MKKFVSSFNRDNLRYEVVPKKSTVTSDVACYIRSQHDGHTGIIYCLAKRDCDQLAATLRREEIEAAAYHADLTDPQVVPKKSTVTSDVACYIRSQHDGHTGIVQGVRKLIAHCPYARISHMLPPNRLGRVATPPPGTPAVS